MKSLAIISEYNPCHKGHAYQIEKARELSGSDIIIALMSGNFVQRGIPAVFDKYTRAGLAVLSLFSRFSVRAGMSRVTVPGILTAP